MARLNIEDDFWKDILKVTAKIGDEKRAVGEAVLWLKHAQDRYKKGQRITESEFKAEGFSEALIGIFAIRSDKGIEAKGAKKHFSWLEERLEAASKGGKKSAQTRSKQNEANPSKSKQAEPSYSYSPSYSNSNSPCLKNGENSTSDEVVQAPSTPVWLKYSKAYKARYDVEPTRNAKINSQLKQLGERLGSEASDVAEFYLSHNDSYYVKTGHSVGALLRDAEKLRTEWFTGRKITTSYAKSAENEDHLNQQMKRIAEGKL